MRTTKSKTRGKASKNAAKKHGKNGGLVTNPFDREAVDRLVAGRRVTA